MEDERFEFIKDNDERYAVPNWRIDIEDSESVNNNKILIHGIVDSIVNRMKGSVFMGAITANDLKVHGVSSIDAALRDQAEATISVRGRDRYVVMDMETYNHLRVCELEAALYQSRREIVEGKGIEESVDEHLLRLQTIES